MSRIYLQFMRHAESLANTIGVEAGKNPPLSENGIMQAKQVGGYCDCIITSCLKRSIQTLEYSKMKCRKVIETELCRELMHGNINDYLDNESFEKHESDQQAQDRFAKLKDLIRQTQKEGFEHILVISHGMFICRMTGQNGMYNCQIIDYNFAID